MRTLNRYLSSSFGTTAALSLLVVTFVMCIGIVFKVTDLIARGVSWKPVLRILGYGLPQALTYSIPISVLTGSLLVFGRLSADGEITAMKASGVNMWAVARPVFVIAAVMSLICGVINNEFVPRGHLAGRQEVARLGVETPLELLEEGRFIDDFPGMTIYIGKRKGMTLSNVRIYDMRREGVRREVRATSGVVATDPMGNLTIELQDVRIDPFADDRPGAAYSDQWTVSIPRDTKRGIYRPDKDDQPFFELFGNWRKPERAYPELKGEEVARARSEMAVELSKRFVLSLSCLAFAVLGIPLGTKAHRKESSVGIGLSLLLVFGFYTFMLIAESLKKRPELFPHLIPWIPIVLFMLIGSRLINRHN